MNVRLWFASAALGLATAGAALVLPVSAAAASTTTSAATAPSVATTAAAASTAVACTDGHWPSSVQGVPTLFHAGARAGDYIWHDSRGWHLRVTHSGTARVVFSGRIVSSAPLDAAPVKLEGRDYVAVSADRKVITYRMVNYGRIDGFNCRSWETWPASSCPPIGCGSVTTTGIRSRTHSSSPASAEARTLNSGAGPPRAGALVRSAEISLRVADR